MVTTSDNQVALKIKALREHGMFKRYYHDMLGDTLRIDALQAAILRIKLRYLESWSESRINCARLYTEKLRKLVEKGLVVTPQNESWSRHVYHLYVIRVNPEIRNAFFDYLKANNVGCQIHYPVPVHLQKAYTDAETAKLQLPVSEKTADCIVSLPLFPELTETEINTAVSCVESFFESHALPL